MSDANGEAEVSLKLNMLQSDIRARLEPSILFGGKPFVHA
jgi:hypothetical protein